MIPKIKRGQLMDSSNTASVIDNLGKWIAIASATSLCLSLIYDWGFFFALNMTFLEVPSQLSDHVRSALLWLAPVIGIAFIALIFESITTKMSKEKSNDKITKEQTKNKQGIIKNTTLLKISLMLAMIAPFTLFILYGEELIRLLSLSFIAMWAYFCDWIFTKPRSTYFESKSIRIFTFIIPVIIFSTFCMGYEKSATIFNAGYLRVTITTQSSTINSAIIVRYLEKGILVGTQSNKIEFIQWPEIKSINSNGEYIKNPGYLSKHAN